MPPKTKTRAMKVLKENIDAQKKITAKSSRKALGDKTNSRSDDNASTDIQMAKKTNMNLDVRPRRERRLPPRYVENQTLKNLSNSKNSPVKQSTVTSKTEMVAKKSQKKDPTKTYKNSKSLTKLGTTIMSPLQEQPKYKEPSQPNKTSKTVDKQVQITKLPTKDEARPKRSCRVQSALDNPFKDNLTVSPFKTPSPDKEDSLIANRPKRICRLPPRFEENSISPNKCIPVQPCYASTPIPQKTNKCINKNTQNVLVEKEINSKTNKDKMANKPVLRPSKSKPSSTAIKISSGNSNTSNSSVDKNSPDPNNNGKKNILRPRRVTAKTKLQSKQESPDIKIKPFAKRLLEKSLSFRVLEDRQSNEKGPDVYEFTFDPNEEPTPQKKKKRKKPVKKRPAKPKTLVFKSNYDDNLSKALANLKSKVKPSQTKAVLSNIKPMENPEKPAEHHPIENTKPSITDNVQSTCIAKPTLSDKNAQQHYSADITPVAPINESVNSIHALNYASIRVEDIAADFEFSDHHNDIDYSPVSSPHQQPIEHEAISDAPKSSENKSIHPINTKDPLNLQEATSFFEEPPIASSSMNVSVRHPLASPWRVEFGTLPMTWHNNTYVKANMTPAVESSFINSEATKKKHVYTNMIPDQEPLLEIFEKTAPAVKQTSIISFYKEVAERNANKKKRRLAHPPTKAIFDDVTGNSNEAYRSPKKAKLSKESTPNTSNNSSKDKENLSNSRSSLSPQKEKDKNCTYFGFDESENLDQENVSPIKVNPSLKKRVLRSRNVLKDLNTPALPSRTVMPVSEKAKLTTSEVVEQMNDNLKSAEDAQLPAKEAAKEPVDDTVAENVDDPSWSEDDDSQSLHLFEDIELVHHMKPHRKSYGKAKKVMFQQSGNSDSDSQHPVRAEPDSSDADDLADLSFHLPEIKQTRNKRTKKKKPKKLLTKAEEKEVEAWAAGFNSMCEDIDEFDLLVE